MNTRSVLASALLLSLAALPVAPAVNASANGIQRCQAPDGTTVYTDKPCGMFGAQATPMSGELLTRLAREDVSAGDDATYADTSIATSTAVGRRSAASGCARSATQLSMDLQGALALADVNRVAESYHWTGMSNAQGQATMERLDRLTTQPLVHAQYFNAQIGGFDSFADASAPLSSSGAAGIMQLSFGHGTARTIVDFDVHRHQGCYFVRF
ncbi:MAG: hypothetical protein A2190_11805 [Lysobacterales bacterium RIFOXYA1_FULL_69_10]|nr:MAG: hypothetical protein A2190_11805 [Xanthomonadales bacterium RIFOXYA1_FULL_69_10]